MAPDTITIDKAYALDLEWENSNQPADKLRCVTYRKAGNGSVTMLTIPGDDSAPCYQAVNGHFQHIAGPTLATWQAQRDQAELEAVLQAEYRDAYETTRSLTDGLHW